MHGLPGIGGGVLYCVNGNKSVDVVLVTHHAYNHQELVAVAVETEMYFGMAQRVDVDIGHDGVAAAVVVAVVVELDDAVVVLARVVGMIAVLPCPTSGHLIVRGRVE